MVTETSPGSHMTGAYAAAAWTPAAFRIGRPPGIPTDPGPSQILMVAEVRLCAIP